MGLLASKVFFLFVNLLKIIFVCVRVCMHKMSQTVQYMFVTQGMHVEECVFKCKSIFISYFVNYSLQYLISFFEYRGSLRSNTPLGNGHKPYNSKLPVPITIHQNNFPQTLPHEALIIKQSLYSAALTHLAMFLGQLVSLAYT